MDVPTVKSRESLPVAALAAARIAIGVTLALAPRRLGRVWLGDAVDQAGARVALRSMAARDAVLGAGALLALRRGRPVRGWLEAGAAADAADLVSTMVAGSRLPMSGRLGVPAFAVAGVAAGVVLARGG
jgi:hypothetical protein